MYVYLPVHLLSRLSVSLNDNGKKKTVNIQTCDAVARQTMRIIRQQWPALHTHKQTEKFTQNRTVYKPGGLQARLSEINSVKWAGLDRAKKCVNRAK